MDETRLINIKLMFRFYTFKKNPWLFDIFRGYRGEILFKNGLILLNCENLDSGTELVCKSFISGLWKI